MRRIAAFLLLALVASGCSAKSLPSHPVAPGTDMPQPKSPLETTAPSILRPNVLRVERESKLNRAPPLTATVTDPELVAELYQRLQNLASAQKDAVSGCHTDWGIRYHLRFEAGAALVAEAVVATSDCHIIDVDTGAALTAKSDPGNTFPPQLARVLGLSADELSGAAYLPGAPRPAPSGGPPAPTEAKARLIVRVLRAGNPVAGLAVRCAPYLPERGQPDYVLSTNALGEFTFPVLTAPETVLCSSGDRELDLQVPFSAQGQIIRLAAQLSK